MRQGHAEVVQMISDEIREIRQLVMTILSNDAETRNSDKKLRFKIWREIQKLDLNDWNQFNQAIDSESIRRTRASIQSAGHFLPTNPDVLIQRGIEEQKIRAYFGDTHAVTREWYNRRHGIK